MMRSEDEEVFHATDAGASLTCPLTAGDIKKGDVVLVDGHPCKVIVVSSSKPGKHGHTKVHTIGSDIFTGRRCEEICPASHSMRRVAVTRGEYAVLDVAADGAVSLLSASNDLRSDLNLPRDGELAGRIRAAFVAGEDIAVVVIGAMGADAIVGYKSCSK